MRNLSDIRLQEMEENSKIGEVFSPVTPDIQRVSERGRECATKSLKLLERVKGIEPSYSAWKASDTGEIGKGNQSRSSIMCQWCAEIEVAPSKSMMLSGSRPVGAEWCCSSNGARRDVEGETNRVGHGRSCRIIATPRNAVT
jgi:hypothetical protein